MNAVHLEDHDLAEPSLSRTLEARLAMAVLSQAVFDYCFYVVGRKSKKFVRPDTYSNYHSARTFLFGCCCDPKCLCHRQRQLACDVAGTDINRLRKRLQDEPEKVWLDYKACHGK